MTSTFTAATSPQLISSFYLSHIAQLTPDCLLISKYVLVITRFFTVHKLPVPILSKFVLFLDRYPQLISFSRIFSFLFRCFVFEIIAILFHRMLNYANH